jgi:glycosyltransferase involved in cell wall biosynthesis
MFSVIIPVYNKAQYIDKCVKSVLAQTFSNFELLIINDGSTDNSLFIVKQFKDARIKIIIKQIQVFR